MEEGTKAQLLAELFHTWRFFFFFSFSACRLCAQQCIECKPPGHLFSCDSHLCAGTIFECPSELKPPSSDITVQTGCASAAVLLQASPSL